MLAQSEVWSQYNNLEEFLGSVIVGLLRNLSVGSRVEVFFSSQTFIIFFVVKNSAVEHQKVLFLSSVMMSQGLMSCRMQSVGVLQSLV